jgi:hypothetical protein
MKKVMAFLAAGVLALPCLALAVDAGRNVSGQARQQQEQGKVVASTTVAERALVKGVDPAKRILTLQFSDGSVQDLLVDPSVRRLGEVHAGDTVKINYNEAISVKLNKSPVPPGVTVQSTVQPNEQSPTPAGTAGTTVSTTATITNVTDNGRKVTLRFPDGSISNVQVQDPENQEMLQRGEVTTGDQITITYLRAVAVSVEKAPKK